MEKIRIALIGAGETGTPLLRTLLAQEFVELVGIADLDSAMPGILLAQQNGVTTTNNFMDFLALGDQVDILIDVTGAPKVREQLRSALQERNNKHTIIMHEMIAVLLMSMAQGKLVSIKHNHLNYS